MLGVSPRPSGCCGQTGHYPRELAVFSPQAVCQLANSVTALSSYSSVAFCVEYATVCEEQDPNTKRFKPTLIYFNTDTQVYWAIQRSWFARVNALCNLSQKKSRKNAFWGILKHEQQVIAYIQTHYDNVPQKMPSTLAV